MQQGGARRWCAGWWPDPWGQGDLRWHDGRQWTSHVAAAPATLDQADPGDAPPARSDWAAPAPGTSVATRLAVPARRDA